MSGARCLACGAPLEGAARLEGSDRLHGTQGRFEVLTCPACGSGTTQPAAGPEELAGYYPQAYGPYGGERSGLLALVSRAIRGLQGRRALRNAPLIALGERAPGRVVDVGCGRGDLAATLIGRGWSATGVEPSAAACDAARARGVDARVGTLADVPLEPGGYDAAVFQHSLEHTPDPAGDLARVHAALHPGGLVLVTVPNFGVWQRRRFGSRWFHLDLPRHRTHFSGAGLRAALERAGFAVETLSTSSSSAGLPATLQYVAAGRCLFPAGLPLQVASGLCVLILPLARLLDRAGGGGDQLHAVARRATASSMNPAIASAGPG